MIVVVIIASIHYIGSGLVMCPLWLCHVQEQVAETYKDGWKSMMTEEIVKNKGHWPHLYMIFNAHDIS